MKINTHYIEVSKRARYVTYGDLSQRTRHFWFVLHGSKMLCEQMIFKFRDFDPNTHFVVAPESLSRFYADGFGGDVVASWMTSRDRLKEIEDIANYLSILLLQFLEKLNKECIVSVLGFSQGGTIAFRWLHKKLVPVDYFIPYSSWIPEDIDLTESETNLDHVKIIYTYGDSDLFINEDLIAKMKKITDKNRLNIQLEIYDGDHRVDKKQLMKIFNKYIAV